MTAVTTPWVVPISELLREPGARRPIDVEGSLGDVGVSGSRLTSGALVEVDGLVESIDAKTVQVRATVTAPWVGECRRCLGEASGQLRIDVSELFERAPESEDIYPLEADRLDLEPLARDAVLLELPQAPLCRGDCLGLCPTCGADRNAGDCGHAADDLDPRWAALRDLRTTDPQ